MGKRVVKACEESRDEEGGRRRKGEEGSEGRGRERDGATGGSG